MGCRSASSWTVLRRPCNDEPAVLEEYYKKTVTSFTVHSSSRSHSLLCGYHHEQAWEMPVKDGKHGLTSKEADQLLAELRACAFASVTKNQYSTSNIQKCGKEHPCVQQLVINNTAFHITHTCIHECNYVAGFLTTYQLATQ